MPAIINLLQSPDEVTQISKCNDFKFQVTDLLITPGVQPIISLTFNDNEPQTIGDRFIFADVEFEVDTVGTYGGKFVDLTSNSSSSNANAFLVAVSMHPVFFNKLTGIITNPSAGVHVLTFTWNDEAPLDALFDFSLLTNPIAYTIDDLGQSPEFIKNYRLGYRVIDIDNNPLSNIQQIPVVYDNLGISNIYSINTKFFTHLKTTLPALDAEEIYDETFYKELYILYGSIQSKDGGCGVDFINWEPSDSFKVLNVTWYPEMDALFNWNDYYYNGANEVKFLTSFNTIKIPKDTYYWLWIYCNARDIPLDVLQYTARIRFYNENDIEILYRDFDYINDGVIIIPAGTANADINYPYVNWDDVCYYTVEILCALNVAPYVFRYSEVFKFVVDHDTCSVPVYFIDAFGSYSFLLMDKQEESYESQFEELYVDIDCVNAAHVFDAYIDHGYKFSIKNKNTEFNRFLFKSFKSSSGFFIVENDKIVRLIPIQENVKIFDRNTHTSMIASFVVADKIKSQV